MLARLLSLLTGLSLRLIVHSPSFGPARQYQCVLHTEGGMGSGASVQGGPVLDVRLANVP